jgi:hypothetical protein
MQEEEDRATELFSFPVAEPAVDCHENGREFRIHPAFVSRFSAVCPVIDIPVINEMYNAAKDNMEKIKAHLCQQNVLPMPMHASPAIAYMSHKNKGTTWRKKTANFMENAFQLQLFRFCLLKGALAITEEDRKQLEIANETYKDQEKRCCYAFANKMETLLHNAEDPVTAVLHALETRSVQYLNNVERFLWQACWEKGGMPLDCILTPNEAISLTKREDGIPHHLLACNFFATKQRIVAQNDVNALFFNTPKLTSRFASLPETEIFRGYLSRRTATEYASYLDVHNHLKERGILE